MKQGPAGRLKKAFRWGAILVIGLGYSIVSYLAAKSSAPSLTNALVAVAPLVLLALVMAWRSPRRSAMLALWTACMALLYASIAWLVAHYNWVFLLDHAGTNLLLCVAFGRTLAAGETPMISRFARIVHGDLSPALHRYTRAATWAWVVYFGAIAGLSLLLFWLAPRLVWSAFANLLGLPLLVLMFAGEYAVRCRALPALDRAGPLESIRAYQQASMNRNAGVP